MAAPLRPVCIFIFTDSNKRRSSIPDPGIEMETLVPETDPKKQKHKKRLKSLYKEIIDQVIKRSKGYHRQSKQTDLMGKFPRNKP